MKSGDKEVEAKFHVGHLGDIEQRAIAGGAQPASPRTLETNLRFDTADGQLRRARRALRLRSDAAVTLAYKGPGDLSDGIRSRPEAEVQVADLAAARSVLEGLGYIVVFKYEKYRTTYRMGAVEIMLDELPYGDFVELEGAADSLRPIAERLGLRWEAAIPDSYHTLFEKLQAMHRLPFRDLTFRNFEGVTVRALDLQIPQADN